MQHLRHPLLELLHVLDQNLLMDLALLQICLLLDSVEEAVQLVLRIVKLAGGVKLLNLHQLLVELGHGWRLCRQRDSRHRHRFRRW